MSIRNGFVHALAVGGLAALIGCGGPTVKVVDGTGGSVIGGSGGKSGSGGKTGSGGTGTGTGGTATGSGGKAGSGGNVGGSGGGIIVGGSGGSVIGGSGGTVASCTGIGSTPITGPTMSTTCNGYATLGTYQGYFYTFSDKTDGGASKICPDCSGTGCAPKIVDAVCAVGTAGKVVGTAYATYWGAGIGWSLSEPQTGCVSGAKAGVDLSGKTISATISTPPTALRLKLETKPDLNICLDVAAKSTISAPTSTFLKECWVGGAQKAVTAADLASVLGIQFQIPTSTAGDVPFNFCVTSLDIQ